MNLCVCCGKEIPEGSQVCYNCKQIASEERPFFIRSMIDDLKEERKQLKKKLFRIEYTINELERAERRL